MLGSYGVRVGSGFLLDDQSARFPVPVRETRGMYTFERVKMMKYPFFPDIRRGGFSRGHVAVTGLQNVVMNWASPIEVDDKQKGVESEVFLRTSENAWTDEAEKILPENFENAEDTFKPKGDKKSYPVAATLTGRFSSFFADKPSPLFTEGGDKGAQAGEKGEEDRTGRTLKKSTGDARLAVVGSSAFASDLVASLSGQMGGGVYRGNAQLIHNLVDWAVSDTDLLQIRSGGAFARTLDPIEEDKRSLLELMNYVFVLVALAVVVIIAITRRRRTKSILVTEGKA
jgi:ABC-2 type transport system permease protein